MCRTKKTVVTENVTWKILLARARSKRGHSNQDNVRQQNVAAHRVSHLAIVPHPEVRVGGAALLAKSGNCKTRKASAVLEVLIACGCNFKPVTLGALVQKLSP